MRLNNVFQQPGCSVKENVSNPVQVTVLSPRLVSPSEHVIVTRSPVLAGRDQPDSA